MQLKSLSAPFKKYVNGLPQILQEHAGALAERGFSKAQQGELSKRIDSFLALLDERPTKQVGRKAELVERESLFKRLRYQTSYFRKLGRKALRTDKQRSDFDRVKLEKPSAASKSMPTRKAAKKVTAPRPEPTADTADAAGKDPKVP